MLLLSSDGSSMCILAVLYGSGHWVTYIFCTASCAHACFMLLLHVSCDDTLRDVCKCWFPEVDELRRQSTITSNLPKCETSHI